MFNDAPKPSPLRIIQCDYPATLSVIAPVASWGLYLALTLFGVLPGIRWHQPLEAGADGPFLFGLAVIVTVGSIILLTWRIRAFNAHFSRSVPVTGCITNVGFFKDRGRVEYRYEYYGKTYSGGNPLNKTGRTKALQPGAEVVLMVDRDNPARAFIRDLYV